MPHLITNPRFPAPPATSPTVATYQITGYTSSSTTWVADAPTGIQTNDLLIAYVVSDDTQLIHSGNNTDAPAPPAGWTERHSTLTSRTAGGDVSSFLYWKLATGSEPSTYTWTYGGSASVGGVVIFRISGANTSTPIDSSGVGNAAAASTSVTFSSLTTGVNNVLLLAMFAADESSNLYDPYWANPPISGFTALFGHTGSTGHVSSSDVYIGACYTTQASAGPTGDKVASIAVENDAITGYLVAIRPV